MDPQPQPKPKDPLIGTRLDGRYFVAGVLGKGGMGIVYEGVHEQLGRPVAIKVLHASIATEPIVVQRFLREARIASSLGHGNIVDVSDLGHLSDGRPYLVMPRIQGISFTKLLAHHGPQTPARVVELLRGVASALDLVHAKGLLHRDVKPENLMHVVREDRSETVMLMDFGIAVLASGGSRLTAEGVVCGTPAFLAPESARGEEADHRADVYSLATVAFELMTGQLPFDDDNPLRILPMKAFGDPPRMSTVSKHPFPEPLEIVVAQGLARFPEQRYASAGAFVEALDAALQPGAGARFAQPKTKPAPPPFVPPPPPRPRGPTESLELPLGASGEFDLDEVEPPPAVSGGARDLSEVERAVTSPSMRAAATPSRRGLYVVAAIGVLAAVGAALAAVLSTDEPAPAKPARAATVNKPPALELAPPPEPVVPAPAPAATVAPLDPGKPPDPEPEPEPAPTPTRIKPKPSAATAPAARAPQSKPSAASAPSAEELNRQAGQALLQGHLAQAAELYEQAATRDSRSVAAWRGLGLTSERLGLTRAAIRAYRRTLQLAPTGPHADSVRERLQKLE